MLCRQSNRAPAANSIPLPSARLKNIQREDSAGIPARRNLPVLSHTSGAHWFSSRTGGRCKVLLLVHQVQDQTERYLELRMARLGCKPDMTGVPS